MLHTDSVLFLILLIDSAADQTISGTGNTYYYYVVSAVVTPFNKQRFGHSAFEGITQLHNNLHFVAVTACKGDDLLLAGSEVYIHTRIQQWNGRKTLATAQDIADDYSKKKLVKAFKKKFACNGTVIESPEYGEVIQLRGDQHNNVWRYLGLAKDNQQKVHGF